METKNKKVTIEVIIPENLDLGHAYEAIADACYFSNNVTNKEYLFICYLIDQVSVKSGFKFNQ